MPRSFGCLLLWLGLAMGAVCCACACTDTLAGQTAPHPFTHPGAWRAERKDAFHPSHSPFNSSTLLLQVGQLMDCLLGPKGLRCPLAKAMMTPVSGGAVPHYISVLRTITEGG